MARLAIIAGQGKLPLDVAKTARAQGRDVYVFPIDGQADADFSAFPAHPIRLGAVGQTRQYFNDFGCSELVMVGKVVWPSLAALRPDVAGVKLLGKMVKRGDDSVLRILSEFFAEGGVKTLPVEIFLDDRKMPSGAVVGGNLDNDATAMIAIGADLLALLGASDVGQSAIVQNGRVLAIEAAEGTNAMIARSKDLIDRSAGLAVFIKMQKSEQDQRLDTPFIGLDTVYAAAAAGIGVLAIEAQNVMLADDLHAITTACENHGIALVGISATDTA
jgi:DUF1009 family protein